MLILPTENSNGMLSLLMKRMQFTLVLVICLSYLSAQDAYYPQKGSWEHRSAKEAGLDQILLDSALRFASLEESQAPKDLELNHYLSFGKEPFGDAIGPTQGKGTSHRADHKGRIYCGRMGRLPIVWI